LNSRNRTFKGLTLAILLSACASVTAFSQELTRLVIGAQGCGPDRLSSCRDPEDRARAEAEKKAQEERAAEARRAQQKRDAMVSEEMKRLGMAPHRRAEAERLADMRLAAEKARGGVKPPGPVSSAQPPAGQDDAAAAARKRREALEAERAERERAEAEAKKKREEELRKHLAAERAGIRLRALKCGGQDTVVGTRPAVSPRIANCISVQYEARCPGVPQGQGIQMVFSNFVGGNSCFGDTQRLSRPLTCKPEVASVDVRSVTVCDW
jgi:hypothetical protein